MSGKAPRDPRSPTSTQGSTDYDILTGKRLGTQSLENADSLGNTALGIEVKERFSSMKQAFLKMDKNRDGRITANEIRGMCRQWNIPQDEAERVLSCADFDANGTLDFNEFAQRFDPASEAEAIPMDRTALPRGMGSAHDERPVGKGRGNFKPPEYDDRESRMATKIQAAQRGRASRAATRTTKANRSGASGTMRAGRGGAPPPEAVQRRVSFEGDETAMPASPSGSGVRAARFIRSGSGGNVGGSDGGEGTSRNSIEERDRLRARVAELEDQLASKGKRSASTGGSQALVERMRELKEALSSSKARIEESEAALAELDAGSCGGGSPGAAGRGEDAEADVLVFGRADCKKTQGTLKELSKAGISFDARDFDADKSFMEALKASGCDPKCKVGPPVVCHGMQAWWDEPDAAIAVHFPSMLMNELRRAGLMASNDIVTEQPLKDVSMDVEIAERFRTMQDAFLKLDDNKDGRISKDELRAMCKKWNIPSSEAERVIGEADFDFNGTLDFREFARRFGR